MSETGLARIEARLSARELNAYQFLVKSNQPKVSPSTSSGFFELFLNGKSCEEIMRLNKGFSLGQIVRCRVEDEWDERRDRHMAELLEGARATVQQRQMEGIVFLTDYMSAFHKLFGDKMKKYMQTGDVGEIQDLPFTFKQYKDILELMMKLTGQENNKKVQGEVVHKHVSAEPSQGRTTLTPAQAAQVLEIIDSKKK